MTNKVKCVVWTCCNSICYFYIHVDESKIVTVNSIANNGKRSYVDVFEALKKKDVKEGEGKDILTDNMQKYSDSLSISIYKVAQWYTHCF